MTDEHTKNVLNLIPALAQIRWKDLQNTLRDVVITFFSQTAIYKARIQKGGRIKIPEEERSALGLKEGDVVQVIIIPLKEGKENEAVTDVSN